MIFMPKQKLVAINSNFKIFFCKSKFARKPKMGTARDSVLCQLYDYKLKTDFLNKIFTSISFS